MKTYGYVGINNLRYIGKTTQHKFIEAVNNNERSSANWVREKLAETGNDRELKIAAKHAGIIVIIEDRNQKIVGYC